MVWRYTGATATINRRSATSIVVDTPDDGTPGTLPEPPADLAVSEFHVLAKLDASYSHVGKFPR